MTSGRPGRDLVAAHGSGRAGYIADTYQPVNLADQPTKAAASDEILVIPTQAPLDAAEAAAVTAYWSAVWAAAGDATAIQEAAAALDAAVGAARAAELLAAYVPFNLSDTPAPPATPQDVAVSTTFVVFPPDPPVKQAPWSQAPQLRQFPERFVVIGYVGGQPVLQAIGGLVTLPLDVGPDPSADPVADPTSAIHPDNGDLYVPDQLRWMVDFDAALVAGMALSIPLTPEQARSGFDRLLVLGVQMATSETDGAAALEELLYHHQVGRSGLSLVPQGTPTHNTARDRHRLHGARQRRRKLRRPQEPAAVHADGRHLEQAGRPMGGRRARHRHQPASRRFTRAAGRTRCRPGPCSGPCGRPRSATGWTR